MQGEHSERKSDDPTLPGPHTVSVWPLGITVTPLTSAETVEWITQNTGKKLLLNHNLHSAYFYQKSRQFREFYARADRVVIDGAPVLFMTRLNVNSGLNSRHRIGSTDWIKYLENAKTPGRLFVYGASTVANRDAVKRLRANLSDSGWHVEGKNGFVDPVEAIEWLRSGRPTLVIVGLGMPLQEKFLEESWESLPAATYATVGGAIDYVAGHHVLAPRWMGSLGIEWLWRLVHDPRRLAHRYLVEPFGLAYALFRNQRRKSG